MRTHNNIIYFEKRGQILRNSFKNIFYLNIRDSCSSKLKLGIRNGLDVVDAWVANLGAYLPPGVHSSRVYVVNWLTVRYMDGAN